MRKVATDPCIATTLTDGNLAGRSINLAITWTQRAVSQLRQRLLDPTGKFARLKESEIAWSEPLARLNRNSHIPLRQILEQFLKSVVNLAR